MKYISPLGRPCVEVETAVRAAARPAGRVISMERATEECVLRYTDADGGELLMSRANMRFMRPVGRAE